MAEARDRRALSVGTRRALSDGMRSKRLSRAIALAVIVGAARAGAQTAGVIAPPPAPKPPPAPTTSAGTSDSLRKALAARRDSLTLKQRLDIVAWVDSAARALASGAPATSAPLTAPPASPPPSRPPVPKRPETPVAAPGTAHYLRD